MTSQYSIRYVIAALACILLLACESEKQYKESELFGRWEVYQAERSGKPTQTVNGAYFEFSDQNQLYTNITGEGLMNGYQLYKNVIVQQGGEKIRYNIETMSSEKMTLTVNINGVDFVLDLIKTSTL